MSGAPAEVVGRVRGVAPEGTTVRAVLRTLRQGTLTEDVVGEAVVNDAGWYRTRYAQPFATDEFADTSLSVRLHAPDGRLIGESAPVLAPGPRTRVDLRPSVAVEGPSEFALIERELGGLDAGEAAIEGAEAAVIEEVAQWLDVDAERLYLLQQARELQRETGLPAEAFYALGRADLGLSLEDLVDIPVHELRTTLEEAAADRVIDVETIGNVEDVVEQLAQAIVTQATSAEAQPHEGGLAEVLEAADLPPETIAEVLSKYQRRGGASANYGSEGSGEDSGESSDTGDAAESLSEGFDEETAARVRLAVQLGELVGTDGALHRALHDMRRDGDWQTPADLAKYSFDDWCDLLEDLHESGRASGDLAEEDDEDAEALAEARAEAILETLEDAFPSAFIRRELAASGDLSPAAQRLLDRVPDHDFVGGSLRARLEREPSLIEGLGSSEGNEAIDAADTEAALEEIEAIERVSRVTPRADEVAVLVGTGMRSAMEIAGTPLRQFNEIYGEALGGRAQAARIHAEAQQAAAGAKLAAVRVLQSKQPMPVVLGAAPAIKDVPDARTLFQAAGGFCDCEHCSSVYSPAAYFVDLLRYLNVAAPDRLEQLERKLKSRTSPAAAQSVIAKLKQHQPLDVLLGRRPDLAHLPLTCENTLTALPYIDLVNELLEATITGGSAAFDTGKTPADVLQAVPQNLSREAYDKLRTSVHPLTLPYHQPLALARAYLGHLGVSRLELLRTLGRGDHVRLAITAEALGMSIEELAMVALPPVEPWKHAGFTAAEDNGVNYVQALGHVPRFLNATGLTLQQVIDLVAMRFLRASTETDLVLETPSPDCDPDRMQIVGLDEARVLRMLRLIRLRLRLGWTFAQLDQALRAFGAADLDADVLEKLTVAQSLARTLDRPLSELLLLWAPIDTHGTDSVFERLFQARAVTWATNDARTFQLREDRTELAQTGADLASVASALLAAFRITSDELAGIRALLKRRGAEPALDLAGLSSIYRVVVLARALQLRMPALDLLLRLVPPEADPFKPGDPRGAQRFVEIVRDVQASDFTPERLAYLFRHESDPRRDPGPLPAQVDGVLASIRSGMADAFTETSRPAEVTSEALRQKLAAVLDAGLLDAALETLDPQSSLTPEKRREFFDRHLAKLFPDPAKTAGLLFEPPPPETPRDALAERWRATMGYVLDYLLPQLRTRRLRGAVVQTLSDTLGLSIPATARLLDGVLKSRDHTGEPLLADFQAMLGSGLTGAYFANATLTGEPAITRADPDMTFAWAGAAPAEGVPATNFSARWRGTFLARVKAPHTFYVASDGAVRLAVTIDGAERVLIDKPAGTGKPAEHASEPVPLDPRQPVALTLEYKNAGGPASLSLQFGTAPGAKQPLPTTSLHPAGHLHTLAPVERSYRRLHKAAMLLIGFGVTDAQLEWLVSDPSSLALDALPMEPAGDAAAVALFQRWRQLAALFALRRKLPRSNADVFDVFRATTLVEAVDRLVLATAWDRSAIEAFLGPDGFAVTDAAGLRPSADAAAEPPIVRLARAMDVQRRVGVAPATLYLWANTIPDADGAAAIVQAVKARYDEKRWLEVARSLNDPLRAERRDALVAYLLPRMRDRGIRNRNQLFEYFLIDVEMNPCMLTSRIRQATGAVQTFFQRALMNLEPLVPPRIIDDSDWKFLKNYRVWEAARKVFLFPEGYIEPELRDDKSPIFEGLERAILQQEIKNDNVEAAFAEYLEQLDEVARLDVRGVWFEERPGPRFGARSKPSALDIPDPPRSEWDHGTYHIFARTFNAPHVWYYRRLENGRAWTAWEKIDADIEGDHLVPVIFQRRMHLFWTSFREVPKPPPKQDRKGDGPPPALGKDWEISLAYSVYDRGRWSRKRLSTGGVLDIRTFITSELEKNKPMMQVDGSRVLSPSDYTLRVSTRGGDLPELNVHLYARAVDSIRRDQFSLSAARVERIATFALEGCNGALVPDRARAVAPPIIQAPLQVRGKRRKVQAAVGTARKIGRVSPFSIGKGGVVNAPAGFRVAGMGYAASRAKGGALLALSAGDDRGLAVALGNASAARKRVSIHPVVNQSGPQPRGLYPFFFQDRYRSYFVRPIYTDWKPPRLVAVPLRPPQRPMPILPGVKVKSRGRPSRGRGKREDVEFENLDLSLLTPEGRDAWEDEQDDLWHPDDAAEAKKPRQRTRPRQPSPAAKRPPARPAPRPAVRRAAPATRAIARAPARRVVLKKKGGYHEQRLLFTPFEHTDTCRFLSTLKSKGLEGLLDFSTTRPQRGRDHALQPNGTWARSGQPWFSRYYRQGPLVDARALPHLDVAFEHDHPYSLYNWELFFHAPLQVAVRLAKDGRHEEAQRWFHFIFDPTTDSSAPSPRRYWRFAPFHENNEYESARELMHLLSYAGKDATIIRRQNQVREQVSAWWEKPFSPHVIARLRIGAYQKSVVMKYIDNLVEWGDKLFRRDTMETIQEATQIYILAANILGPRPEKIPPIVSRPPLTFAKMRNALDLFSNVEVRFENLQVRKPFRIAARPDQGGATAVLGMATQYFCTPANPQLDKYWDTVADRLFKIRNCMNIQGIVRQLALFDPPIDPGLLVRAAAAGVDLGSVIASLNAPPPHHRFRVLLDRALRLAEEVRSFGALTRDVLERKDAEALATLRAGNETRLLEAVRDIRKKQVKQVEEELAELSLQREHIELQMQHLNNQLNMLMNPQEMAAQKSLSAAQVITGVTEGVELVAKVMHAIPEFQTGGAGAFSSPFVTLQLGGQMFGDIATAFAASLEKVMSKHETEADLAAAQAEYQRRREEWQHELELLAKEKARIDKRIVEINLKLEISNAELRRHDIEVDNSGKVGRFLRDKWTNEQLYGWMIGQVSGSYFQAYKVAFDAAQMAERAFRFERGTASSSYIEFSYWDSLKKGLLAGERLLIDLRRLEAAHVDGDRRGLEVTRQLSLRDDFPLAWIELIETGRCQIEVSEALLDGDFPGHYFRRVKTASVTITGTLPPHRNVNATLTLLENRIRTDANASGAYAQQSEADDSRFLINIAPIQAVATSRPDNDPGVFRLRFEDDRYLPFEGAGAISTWRLELHQADNAIDLSQITDVVLSIAYSARTGGAALEASARGEREKLLARGGLKPEARQLVSLKADFPAAWKQITEAAPGQEVEVTLPLEPARFSGRYRGLDLRIERVVAIARPKTTMTADAIKLRIDPPKGSGTAAGGWAPAWPRAQAMRATIDVSGPAGSWKLGVTATSAKAGDIVDDIVLVFDLRAKKA